MNNTEVTAEIIDNVIIEAEIPGYANKGLSAYQVWLEEGNTGTEQDFIDSLKGEQGEQGIQGIQGEQGIQGIAGTNGTNGEDGISFIWQGTYSSETTYSINDAVSYNGSSYICKLESTGNLPTNTTYWDLMAQKGTDGEGAGDMLKATYDPTNKNADAFSMDNMSETSTKKVFTSTERTKLSNIAENANNYSLPTATNSVLGGVKVGSRLTMTDGVLSADAQSTDISGKEDKTNKKTTLADNSDTYYPTQKAVKTAVDGKIGNVVEDTTPQLGGDLDCNNKNITGLDSISTSDTQSQELNINAPSLFIGDTAHTDNVTLRLQNGSNYGGIRYNAGEEQLELYNGSNNLILPNKSGSVMTDDGWINPNETWTYVSVDDPTGVIKIQANVTTKYSLGMRIKMTNGGNTIYGIITKIGTYGGDLAGYTYITFLHEINPTNSQALYLMANSAITNNYYSGIKIPFGFPACKDKWTIYSSYAISSTQATPTNSTWYNLGSRNIVVPIGCYDLSYNADCWATQVTAGRIDIGACLSTTNNGCSDTELKARNIMSDMKLNGANFSRTKTITLTSKTTYYLNFYVENATSPTNLGSDGNAGSKIVLKAVCSYL